MLEAADAGAEQRDRGDDERQEQEQKEQATARSEAEGCRPGLARRVWVEEVDDSSRSAGSGMG